ncbi:MAG: urate hydroxylase PuuD [Bdellovibrionales bacterium]|nr:urate hydroxylase PuuD [Bdellovibrionales bacterium]
MELLNDGFIFRYFHIWFGIIWIGILYYFNFVQTPFFNETDAATKSGAIQKLVPRALWWFRWAAMMTFLTGLYLLRARWFRTADDFGNILTNPGGLIMMLGVLLGTTMFLNVWLIIWPNQKVLIASTTAVAQGGKADPNAAAAGARAGVASRTNTLFSIPLVLFMTMGAHLPLQANRESGMYMPTLIIILLIYAAIEFNAIKGKLHKPLATVQNVVTSGFVLTVVFYALIRMVCPIA